MSHRRECLGPSGAARIAEERERQILKWSASHDDDHDTQELAVAAALLAVAATESWVQESDCDGMERDWWATRLAAETSGDAIRQLTIAGALCAAEIDRLLRFNARRAT